MHAAQWKPCMVPELPWISGPYPLPERIPPTLDLTDGCRGQPLLPAELHTAHRAPVSPDKCGCCIRLTSHWPQRRSRAA